MTTPADTNLTTIAISKGRVFEESLPLLSTMGIGVAEENLEGRKLVLPTSQPGIRLLVVRSRDVPTYVQHGVAELGIVGKDVLMEFTGGGIYEPVDLGIAKCRLMVAATEPQLQHSRRLRVATKYVRSTQQHFAAKGLQVELIKLYGSMELAPVLGLADCIVDLVATGNTLKANGLTPVEHVADISCRLIVNKAAMKIKSATLRRLIEQFKLAARE